MHQARTYPSSSAIRTCHYSPTRGLLLIFVDTECVRGLFEVAVAWAAVHICTCWRTGRLPALPTVCCPTHSNVEIVLARLTLSFLHVRMLLCFLAPNGCLSLQRAPQTAYCEATPISTLHATGRKGNTLPSSTCDSRIPAPFLHGRASPTAPKPRCCSKDLMGHVRKTGSRRNSEHHKNLTTS